MVRIAVDAMGGDTPPAPNIEGAMAALSPGGLGEVARKEKIEIILVGNKELLKKELAERGASTLPLEIKDASQVIGMDESPIEGCRSKPDSSIIVGMNMVASGDADGFVSAGNSGAVMAAAVMCLDRLKGVSRPAIAAAFPTIKEPCLLVDVGANADCKSKHLYQFALMGEAYVKYVYKRRIPRVGLLSMGHEEGKGSTTSRAAYKLLMKSPLNFIGNVEGTDIVKGVADVIVCDGFTGNVVLKFGESLATTLLDMIKQEVGQSFMRKVGAGMMRGAFYEIKKKMNYEEIGGAPLLGVNGSCVISHGSSTAKAMKNAINVAAEYVEQNLNQLIEEGLE